MKLQKIETVPIGKKVLLYWNDSKHYENGIIFYDGECPGNMCHMLDDFEDTFSGLPTHWTELPMLDE